MGVNPFINDLRITVTKIVTETELVGIRKNEEVVVEVVGEAAILNKFYAEVENYTKIFQAAEHRKALSLLPARAKELVIWLIFEMKPSKDYVIINIERYKKENRCSHSTYLRAINDLWKANIVAPTTWQAVYWVNPAFMFNGNRINKYKDNLSIFEKREVKKIRKTELIDELK